MRHRSSPNLITLLAMCLVTASFASAGTVVTYFSFPTAGDYYYSATDGSGYIPLGGQGQWQRTAGDYVASPVITLLTTAVTHWYADTWTYVDDLGDGGAEAWDIDINGIAVARFIIRDCGFCGTTVVMPPFNGPYTPIAPVNGGYQLELVLENTVPEGEGSVAWADGGITGLSYTPEPSTAPEPGSMLLIGSGAISVSLMRRRLRPRRAGSET